MLLNIIFSIKSYNKNKMNLTADINEQINQENKPNIKPKSTKKIFQNYVSIPFIITLLCFTS